MPSMPRALLLDFGGVIVDYDHRPTWAAELAHAVHTLLTSRGVPAATPAGIAADLTAGLRAYGRWCDAMVRPYAPTELRHEQFWSDFVAADWPAAAREVVLGRATALCQRLGEVRYAWQPRPGVAELLADLSGHGVLLAIVSNALCGAVHRDFLERAGLADRFAVQLYSDETGVRKPNPELLFRAIRALGVSADQAWFVGDTRSRDVACGRRARVGATVLMRSRWTGRDETEVPVGAVPDFEVGGYDELAALFGIQLRLDA
jgi:HAD superfamily hydrolase (TIGR01549 family)